MFLFANRLVSNFCVGKNDRKFGNRICNFLPASARNCQHSESHRPKCSSNGITFTSSRHEESFVKMKNEIINELVNYNGFTDECGPGLAETMPLVARRLRTVMEQIDKPLTWNYTRAMTMIRLCEELVRCESNGNRELTADEYQKIYAMGWFYTLFEIYTLINDDVVDDADIRAGRTTWHRQNNNHEITMYESLFLNNAARLLTTKYFAGQPFYHDIQKTLSDIDVLFQWGTTMGLLLAANTWPSENIADTYLWDVYTRRGMTITGLFLSGPLKLALSMVNKYDEKTAAQIDQVSYAYGITFQTYDDYLDHYGAVQLKDESCNDIANGQRSFLSVLAFKYGNEHQRNILLEHYGKKNADSVAAVEEVYRQLDIKSKCEEQHKLIAKRAKDCVAKVDDKAVRNVSSLVVDSLHEWHY